jgi:hypothetical protein
VFAGELSADVSLRQSGGVPALSLTRVLLYVVAFI